MFSRAKRNRIYNLLRAYDGKLTKIYLEEGPDTLKKKLNIESEDVWKLIFEYLIFEKNIVKQCVRRNPEYIHKIFAERGPDFLRHAFQIADERYDDIWEYVMDYIGISRGAIYEYITSRVVELKGDIYNGKIEGIRIKLGLQNIKYDRAWEEIFIQYVRARYAYVYFFI